MDIDGPLVVLYRRAADLRDELDPRENALTADARWVLAPGRTLGFGRAPAGVDIPVRLVEEDGEPEPTVPRLAGRIAARDGSWMVTNHATGAAKLLLTAPDVYREITRHSQEEILRRRRQLVTVRTRGGDVEHRFTLLLPQGGATIGPGSDDEGLWDGESDPTYGAASPEWHHGDRRTLAAYCYGELHGLPPRQRDRGSQTLRLLERPADPASRKWLEKQLARLRADAARRLRVSLDGERGTPLFIEYVVSNRGLLFEALREFDGHPRLSV